jgi:spore maturation protein CgeB
MNMAVVPAIGALRGNDRTAGAAPMRILLCDVFLHSSVNPYFADAMKVLAEKRGYIYEVFDQGGFTPRRRSLLRRLALRMSSDPYRHEQRAMNQALLAAAREYRPDLILAVNGKAILADTLAVIHAELGATVVAIPTDDPFSTEAVPRSARDAVGYYDLWACPKRAVLDDLAKAGCRNVKYIHYWYRSSECFPESPATAEEARKFDAEVIFIGNSDSARAKFFAELVRRMPGLKLAIYGGGWRRHLALRKYLRRPVAGRDFRLALAGTRIALHMVRHSQRDDHSERSIQTPACGAFMLAERTDTHEALFAEDREAAFFSDLDDLCAKITYYLAHDEKRREIAAAGHRKVTSGKFSDLDRLTEIVDAAIEVRRAAVQSGPPAGCP